MSNDQLKTNVSGLDEILGGGIAVPSTESKHGMILLLKGRPGTGKTTLALQLALAACSWPELVGRVRYFSCEQTKESLNDRGNKICNGPMPPLVEIDAVVAKGEEAQKPSEESKLSSEKAGLAWARYIVRQLADGRTPQPGTRPVIVVDGLNLLDREEKSQLDLRVFVDALRWHCRLAILNYDTGETSSSSLDFMADMVIHLKGEVGEQPLKYYLNKLSILKSRFQPCALGWHQYKIGEYGMRVYPSLHYWGSKTGSIEERWKDSYMALPTLESQKGEAGDANEELGELLGRIIGAKIRRGSCTVILGPRRTHKTLLTLDFLRSWNETSGSGLLVSLMDNQGTIAQQRTSVCNTICQNRCPKEKRGMKCFNNTYLLHFRPGCISSDEFFSVLIDRLTRNVMKELADQSIERLVFWDLTQLGTRFPLLAADPLFVPMLMDYLKNRDQPKPGITSLFMGAPNTELGRSASAVADNVLICWKDKYKAQNGDIQDGVCVYVDRVEGEPAGERRLSWLVEVEKEGEEKQIKDEPVSFLAEQNKMNANQFEYANGMIERIQELQGLAMLQDNTGAFERIQDVLDNALSSSEKKARYRAPSEREGRKARRNLPREPR